MCKVLNKNDVQLIKIIDDVDVVVWVPNHTIVEVKIINTEKTIQQLIR